MRAGQLAGSLLAAWLARAGAAGGSSAARMQALPMLVSAALLEAAGRCLASLKPAPGASAARIPCSTHQKVFFFSCILVSGHHVLREGTPYTQQFLILQVPEGGVLQGHQSESMKVKAWRSTSRLWDGFRSIRASRYLSMLTVYIILNTTISSMMYFEKTMVSKHIPC